MEKPKYENFNLSKVKIDKAGGLVCEYQLTEVVGDDACVTDYAVSNTRAPHPDLLALFPKLRGIIGRVLGVTSVLEHLQSEHYPAMEGVEKYLEGTLEQYDVRGVAWSGSGSKAGVVITSVFKTPLGLKTCINTPRLPTGTESYGFEDELLELTETIKTEVYEYLFNGKQAQLSLFGQE